MNTQFLPDPKEHPMLLRIEGMSCAGCVRSVENALAGVPGVDAASVNFASETAAVTGAVDAALLLQAVKNAGYEARPYEQQSIAAQEGEISQTFRWSFARSAIALAGGAALMADMYLGWLPPLTEPLPWLIIGLVTLVVRTFLPWCACRDTESHGDDGYADRTRHRHGLDLLHGHPAGAGIFPRGQSSPVF
jgi:copper chaperone CopZ